MWQYHNPNPKGKLVGDCTVRAISTATGKGWMDTYLDLCLFGLLNGDMPSSNAITTAYLKIKASKDELSRTIARIAIAWAISARIIRKAHL